MVSKQKKLFQAVKDGRIEDVKELLKEDSVDLNGKYDSQWGTALHWSCEKGHRDIVELLLDCGADIEARTLKIMATPLLCACSGGCIAGHASIAKLLLERGADMHAVNKDDTGALHYACFYGYDEVVQLLLKRGADSNAFTKANRIPLHFACYYGHAKCVKELLRYDVQVDVKDLDGHTPLDYARTNGHLSIVKTLEEYERNMRQKNRKEGATYDNSTLVTSVPTTLPKESSVVRQLSEESNSTSHSDRTDELKIKGLENIYQSQINASEKRFQLLEKKFQLLEEKFVEESSKITSQVTLKISALLVKTIQDSLEKKFNDHQEFVEDALENHYHELLEDTLENKLRGMEEGMEEMFIEQSSKISTQVARKNGALGKKIQDSLGKKFEQQQRLVEQSFSSKINDALLLHASEAQKHSQSANEILTHTMNRNQEALETILNDQKALLDNKIDMVGEKLQSKIVQDVIENGNNLRSATHRTISRTEEPQHLQSKSLRNDSSSDYENDGEKEGGIDETTSFHSIVSEKAKCNSQLLNEQEARMTPGDRDVLLLDREDDGNALKKGGVKSKKSHLRERQVKKKKPSKMHKHGNHTSTAKDEKKLKFRVGMEEESRSAESRKVEENTQDRRGKPYEY